MNNVKEPDNSKTSRKSIKVRIRQGLKNLARILLLKLQTIKIIHL